MRTVTIATSLVLSLVGLPSSAASAPAARTTPAPVATRDTTRLGIPWTRYTTTDRFGRTITFYLSNLPDSLSGRTLPLALVIEGSGAQSVWTRVGDRIGGSGQNLFRRAAKGRARVMIVEKPGVEFCAQVPRPGGAEGASETFLREHTRERWAEANAAALRAVIAMPGIDRSRVLAVGHSEGGTIAAAVAARCPEVAHVAMLSAGGATQLFDLAESFGAPQPGDTAGAADARRESAFEEWARIQADPESITKFWMGHPYRRWSSFLARNDLDDLLATKARVFLAHGTEDRSVPVVAFDWLRAELVARGRDVSALRLRGLDHGFFGPEGPPEDRSKPVGIEVVFGRVLDWWLAAS